MWLITRYGFFSTVAARDQESSRQEVDISRIVVRSRVREHLEQLCERFRNSLQGTDILDFESSEYPYRIVINKTVWARVVSEISSEIEYTDFRSELLRSKSLHKSEYARAVDEAGKALRRIQTVNTKPATLDEFETLPMPEKQEVIHPEGAFSRSEMKRIKQGHRAGDMDDKWFMCFHEGRLQLHRSWTGICVYIVDFRDRGESSEIEQVVVNRDPEQYGEDSSRFDEEMVLWLLRTFLLDQDIPFPTKR